MIRTFVTLLILLLTPTLATAQDAAVSARASQDEVEAGTAFSYQADVSVRGASDIELVTPPNFGQMQVVGQQKYPQIITINGVTERRLSLRYSIIARTEGSFTIEPPTFRIDKEKRSAEPVTVKVVKAGATPRAPKNKRDSRFFIEVGLEPNATPYVGEQVTLRYDLYVDGGQTDVQPASSREPSLDDFWIQDLSDRVPRRDQMVSVKGRLYKRSSLWTYAVFPLRAGPIEIEPAAVELVVGSFFRRGQAASLRSEALKLDIKPLPPEAPEGFYEGNVGNWSLKVGADQSQTRVGRAVTVEVRVAGEGQASRVKLPTLPPIEGTRVSDVDEDAVTNVRGTTLGGIKTAKYSITPEREGKITIPAIEFSYFDPKERKYRTTRSEPFVVSVAKGELGPAPVDPAKMNRRTVSADADLIDNLVSELHDVRQSPTLSPAPNPARFPWPYWGWIGLCFAGFVGVAFGPRLRAYTKRAAPEREQRNRSKAAVDRLNEVTGSDAEELAKAIRDGLYEAYDVPRGAVTANDIVAAFEARGLDVTAATELAEVLRECEEARFAPSGKPLSSDLARRAAKALQQLAAVALLLICFTAPARATEWTELKPQYQATAADHPRSVDALYNHGTAAARTGDYGTARLSLERAAYLAPWDESVEHNRSIVERIVRLQTIEQSRTGRTMEGDETLFWWRTAAHTNPHLLGLGSGLLWLLAAACIVIRRRSDVPAVRDAALVALVLIVFAALNAAFGVAARRHVLETGRPVVVTGKLELREGPNVAAKLKRKPPVMVRGTLVRVVDKRDEWVKVTWQTDAAWTKSSGVAFITDD